MADRRRRRRQTSHSESEYSENEDNEGENGKKKADSESVNEKVESDDDEDYTYTEDETCTEYGEGDSVIIEEEFDEGWVDGERQSGDGEEQPDKSKDKLDDDQDRKNPAYVPRKGAFYEHDYREGEERAKQQEDKPRKKLWQDTGKWLHDKFNEQDQAPKCEQELVAMYGYDIRTNERLPDGFKRKPRRMDRRHQLMDYLDNSPGPLGPGGDGYKRRGGRGRGRGGPPPNHRAQQQQYIQQQRQQQQQQQQPQNQRRTYNDLRVQRNESHVDDEEWKADEINKAPSPAPAEPVEVEQPLKRPSRQQKAITPDRIPPKKNIEGVLECAPPLTTVETRTIDEPPKKSYGRDRRGGKVNKSSLAQPQHPDMVIPPNFQESSTIGPPPSSFAPVRPTNKRYSSQRQRTTPDVPYSSGNPPPAGNLRATIRPQGQRPPFFQRPAPPVYRQPRPPQTAQSPPHTSFPQQQHMSPRPPALAYTMAVTSPPTQLVYNPAISQPSAMVPQPQYITPLVNYAGYQMAPPVPVPVPVQYPPPPVTANNRAVTIVTSALPVPVPGPDQTTVAVATAAAAPPPTRPPVATFAPAAPIVGGTPPAIQMRGGTTYFNPEVQNPSRSPVRRPKAAIPIVNPQDLDQVGGELEYYDDGEYQMYSQGEYIEEYDGQYVGQMAYNEGQEIYGEEYDEGQDSYADEGNVEHQRLRDNKNNANQPTDNDQRNSPVQQSKTGKDDLQQEQGNNQHINNDDSDNEPTDADHINNDDSDNEPTDADQRGDSPVQQELNEEIALESHVTAAMQHLQVDDQLCELSSINEPDGSYKKQQNISEHNVDDISQIDEQMDSSKANEHEDSSKNNPKEDSNIMDEQKDDSSVRDEQKEDSSVRDEQKEDSNIMDEHKEDSNIMDEQKEDSSVRDEQKEDSNVMDGQKEDSNIMDEQKEDSNVMDEHKEDSSVRDEQKEDSSVRDGQKEDSSVRDGQKEDSSVRDEQKDDSIRMDEQKENFIRMEKQEENVHEEQQCSTTDNYQEQDICEIPDSTKHTIEDNSTSDGQVDDVFEECLDEVVAENTSSCDQ